MSRLLAAQRAWTVPGWVKEELSRKAQAIPSLDLQFANSKSLVDSATGANPVTFTRASSGTFVGSDGVLQTATTNLLLQSEDFSTSWFLTSATLSTNAIAAPNGTLTAEQLIETATTANHEAGQIFASPVANATYTLSCYLKAATSTTCGIRFSAGLNGTGIICSVDLTAQTATVTAGTGTATIANVGSGWFRVSLTATASGTPASTTVNIFRSLGTAGSIANSIYLWGAQLEQSATVGEYIPTTSTINSAPRFDHNPTTGESLGLLVEEQRTNSIRNNTMVGAVAGTPGTLPTNWSDVGIGGITRQIVGIGTENGVNYADIRYSGTPSANSFLNITPDLIISASQGQTWSGSFWGKLVAGSFTNSNANIELRESDSGQTFLTNTLLPISVGGSLIRYTSTRTLTNASVAFASVRFVFQVTGGLAIDFTVRIGLPQLEQGAFATSVIPTTTAAATRSADVASITGANFSSWYRQDEGTVFVDAASYVGAAAVSRGVLSIDGAAGDVHRIFRQSDLQPVVQTLVSSVSQSLFGFGATWSTAASRRIAYGYAANNFGGSTDGSAILTDNTGTIPTINTLNIGNLSTGNHFGGTIRRLTFWPQRLANSTLQVLTQ